MTFDFLLTASLVFIIDCRVVMMSLNCKKLSLPCKLHTLSWLQSTSPWCIHLRFCRRHWWGCKCRCTHARSRTSYLPLCSSLQNKTKIYKFSFRKIKVSDFGQDKKVLKIHCLHLAESMQSKVPSSLDVAPLALGTDFPSGKRQQAHKIVRKRMTWFIVQIGQ